MVATTFVPVASAGNTTMSPRQHQLRTYIVLNAKSRLRSCSNATSDEPASPTSSTTSTMSDDSIPDDCLAYESYAAVASRLERGRSASGPGLRWSDLNRPRLHLATFLRHQSTTSKHTNKSRRQLRRQASASNEHLEVHALELCFEFLDLPSLQTATQVCTEFRDVITSSGRLLLGLYARQWHHPSLGAASARAYHALSYRTLLTMLHTRSALTATTHALSTRSETTPSDDGTVAIVNNSLLRSVARGAVDSVRGVQALPNLPCASALKMRVAYFEVTLAPGSGGSVGVVNIADATTRAAYGFGSDAHVGWAGVAFGYHGNEGDIVYNDGSAPYGGDWRPYGPSWGNSKTAAVVGCGVNYPTNQIFFTLNGAFLGFAPVTVPDGEYAAAVSLHEFGDKAVLNTGSAPFAYDVEGFCASP